MPDIVNVSDSILRFANKTRLFSQTTIIGDAVDKVTAKAVIKTLSDDITISESTANLNAKQRITQDTTTIAETLQAYVNGIEIVPVVDRPEAEPPHLLGTRERAVRIPRRAPRAIVIDEINNTVTAPLKLLARLDNRAIVGVRPRLTQNVARVTLRIMNTPAKQLLTAHSDIKTQLEPITVKARLALQSSSRSMWATALGRLKTRPEIQRIESLKAINADRIDKLHKLAMLAMTLESL
jgi:hypothetical protein